MYQSIPKAEPQSSSMDPGIQEDDVQVACLPATSSGKFCPSRIRSFSKAKIIALCLLLAAVAILTTLSLNRHHSKAVFADIDNATDTCQQVQPQLYPFLTGCPEVCGRAISPDEPMYRMTMEWYFGQRKGIPGTAYDKGINFQSNPEFVEHFRNATEQLATKAKSILLPHGDTNDNNTHLIINKLTYMHMSLAYLCCLRRNETDWAREAMYQWVQEQSPFYHLSVAFDDLQCWREGPNSITNIIVADEPSQRQLIKLSDSLVKKLNDFKVPVVIPRLQQMPFHVTLMGFRYAPSEDQYYSKDPRDDIGSQIPHIYEMVSSVSNEIGNAWTGMSWNGRSPKRMPIHFGPYFDFQGTLHAGKED